MVRNCKLTNIRRAVKILRRRRKLRRPLRPLLTCVDRHMNILNRSMELTIFVYIDIMERTNDEIAVIKYIFTSKGRTARRNSR